MLFEIKQLQQWSLFSENLRQFVTACSQRAIRETYIFSINKPGALASIAAGRPSLLKKD